MTFRPSTVNRILLLPILMVVILTAGSQLAAAANEVPVHDADLIDTAKKQLEQETDTAEQQLKATNNQLKAWRNTFEVARLKEEILDIFSEKILAYTQDAYSSDGKSPGPIFVTNWIQYLQTAQAKGRENAIKKIEFSLNTSYFCFAPQVITLLRNPIATVPPNDPNCILSNINETHFDNTLNKKLLYTDDPASCTTDSVPVCKAPYEEVISGIYLPDNTLSAPAGKAYYRQSLNATYAALKEYVDSMGTLAQRAAEDEAIASGGFLSTKNVYNKKDALGNAITPDDPANPDAIITTPGSVIAHLTQQAAGLDLEYIANADQLDKDALQIIADSFVTELTKQNSVGLTNLDICAHAQARANRVAKANDTEPEQIDCSAYNKHEAAASAGATNGVTNGKTDAEVPDTANELIAKVTSLINNRGVSANLFDETIRAAADFIARFTKAGGLDPDRECRTSAEISSHTRRFRKGDGSFAYRTCMTQEEFNNYNDFQTKLEDDRRANADKTQELTSFRSDVQSLNQNDPDYASQVSNKIAQLDSIDTEGAAQQTQNSIQSIYNRVNAHEVAP